MKKGALSAKKVGEILEKTKSFSEDQKVKGRIEVSLRSLKNRPERALLRHEPLFCGATVAMDR